MLSRHDAICDLLFHEDECLALVGDQLLRLGPLASFVLACCETPQPRHAVKAGLIEQFGQPLGDADQCIAELIRELTQRQLLVENDWPTGGNPVG